MAKDISSRQLHDRATRGDTLTEAEQASLAAWYERQDAAETPLIGASTTSAANVQGLRSDLEAASAQLIAVTQNIQTLVEENNALRQEIASLSQQLEQTSPLQPV